MAPTRPSIAGNAREAGFTLTELLVVLAIIGLLIMAAPLAMQSAMPQAKSLGAARTLATDLRAARGRAVSRGERVRVHFDTTRQIYSVGSTPHALPDGVRFLLPAPDVDFQPDGSSSGSMVTVGTNTTRHVVRTDWLTGRTAIDE